MKFKILQWIFYCSIFGKMTKKKLKYVFRRKWKTKEEKCLQMMIK